MSEVVRHFPLTQEQQDALKELRGIGATAARTLIACEQVLTLMRV